MSTLPGADVLGSEASRLAREAARRLSLHEFAGEALTAGIESLRAAPGFAAGLAIVAPLSASLALNPSQERQPAEGARRDLLAAFGVAVFFACWLPLLAARGTPVSSRLVYAPSLGLAIVLSVALDRLTYGRADATRRATLIRGVVTGMVMAIALLACVAMVGVQAACRARAHADTALGQELARTVPDPLPGTLFRVLDDARRPVGTGAAAFDGEFMSALLLPQAPTPWVRWASGRRDLFAAQAAPWGVRIAAVADEGARIVGFEPAFPMSHDPDPRGGIVIPWTELMPLRVGSDGRVQVESAFSNARAVP